MSSIRISMANDVFMPGDTVEGAVELNVTKTVKARGISVSLRGEEIVKAPKGKTSITVFDKTIDLTKGRSFPKQGKYRVVGVDKYDLPFAFKLPKDAIPSFSSTSGKATVSYGVNAKVDIPRARDITGSKNIAVRAVGAPKGTRSKVIFLSHLTDYSLTSVLAEQMKPEIRFSCKLDKAIYNPGEIINGVVTLEDKDLVKDARAIEITLSSIEEVRSKLHHVRKGDFSQNKKKQKTLRIPVSGLELGTSKFGFEYHIPANARPTARGKFFDLEWFLEVNIDVPKAVDVKARGEITVLP